MSITLKSPTGFVFYTRDESHAIAYFKPRGVTSEMTGPLCLWKPLPTLGHTARGAGLQATWRD